MPGDPFFPPKDVRYPALRLTFSHAAPETVERGIALLAEILGASRSANLSPPFESFPHT
jgi:2-aminoadipate transaminase